MQRFFLALPVLAVLAFPSGALPATGKSGLSLPPNTLAILNQVYSGRADLAIPAARTLQEQNPKQPIGYLLEAEARWWKIWCGSAEFKYGMTMARHREKLAEDQPYLDLSAKAYALAAANLAQRETAEMRLYAGMADALAARLYGLRGEGRATAKAGVRARENLQRALALDPSLADANLGLGLYNYYVDTLSTMARVLRFVMGIPGGSKQEGIRQLHTAISEGQLTQALARFYLTLNLDNFDQRYQEALDVISPLADQYPENPLFQLVRGDLYARLGRKDQALNSYLAARAAKVADEGCNEKVQLLVRESLASIGARGQSLAQP